MKYIKQEDGTFAGVDEASQLFKDLSALPEERRPKFVDASDKDVKAFVDGAEAKRQEAEDAADGAQIYNELLMELIKDKFDARLAAKRKERADARKAKK